MESKIPTSHQRQTLEPNFLIWDSRFFPPTFRKRKAGISHSHQTPIYSQLAHGSLEGALGPNCLSKLWGGFSRQQLLFPHHTPTFPESQPVLQSHGVPQNANGQFVLWPPQGRLKDLVVYFPWSLQGVNQQTAFELQWFGPPAGLCHQLWL